MYLITACITAIALAAAEVPATEPDPETNRMLFDFRHEDTSGRWQRLNDTVMGGVSQSFMGRTDDYGVFGGTVSLENNGGFASVRSLPEAMDLQAYDAFALRVRGDGHRYALGVRTDPGWDGVSYHAAFDTVDGEWVDVVVPFSELVPQWRGRHVPQAGPLDPSAIQTFGIMISDKQEGDFRLEIETIRAIRRD